MDSNDINESVLVSEYTYSWTLNIEWFYALMVYGT